VITTNLNLADIEPRLRSRLLDQRLTTVVRVVGSDSRLSGGM
jgi:hypothetical protein